MRKKDSCLLSRSNAVQMEVFQGIMIPFLGTALGSACVLFMKKKLNLLLQRALTGFAAGVMVAASIWSLLVPAMEQSGGMGQWAFVPAVGAALTILAAGFVLPLLPYLLSFAAGAMVYVVVEELIPEMSEGKHSNVGTVLFAAGFTVMMALDVALG